MAIRDLSNPTKQGRSPFKKYYSFFYYINYIMATTRYDTHHSSRVHLKMVDRSYYREKDLRVGFKVLLETPADSWHRDGT